MSTTRFPRSTREAFPCERFAAVEHYRAPLLLRLWRPVAQVLFVAVLFSALAAVLFFGQSV